jgi:hypothetical protein
MDKFLHCRTGWSSGNATRHDRRVRTVEQIRDRGATGNRSNTAFRAARKNPSACLRQQIRPYLHVTARHLLTFLRRPR